MDPEQNPMTNFFSTLLDGVRDKKISSPLYGIFFSSFVAWNWQIVYALFWREENACLVPGGVLLKELLWTSSWLSWLGSVLWVFAPPVLITFLAITQLPKIQNWAHGISVKNQFLRRNNYETEALKHEREKKEKLGNLVAIKKEQNEARAEIRKITTLEEQWEFDFQKFTQTNFVDSFRKVINVVYKNNGWIHDAVGSDVIAFLETSDVIEKMGDGISFTSKGKYFVKSYLEKYGAEIRVEDIPF